MAKIGLMSKGSDQLTSRGSVADTDRIPVYTATGTEPELMTVSQLSAGGVLDDNNTWTGTNNFTGGLSIGGTAITATGAEINKLDDSAQLETIDSGVAISVTKRNTDIDNTVTGAGAITLAVPGADMVGKIKNIEMTVDGGDVTLALTNVQGQSSGTTATFGDVGDQLVLIGSSSSKWTVIKEFGIALS